MTSAATTALEFRVTLAAAPTRVFLAMTRPAHMIGWFCDAAETDPRPGGLLVLRWFSTGSFEPPYEGRWIDFDPPRTASFEGGHAGYPNGHAGRVIWTFRGDEHQTELTVNHVLPAAPEYEPVAEKYRPVWPHSLAKLTTYLASRVDQELDP